MARYNLRFSIFDSAETASEFCAEYNAKMTRYGREHHPAHFTPWNCADGRERGLFVVWYWEK